jgi:hypothetical protein
MQGQKDEADIILQIIATGMYLSLRFGITYQAIEKDGLQMGCKVGMLTKPDTPVGVAKSLGLLMSYMNYSRIRLWYWATGLRYPLLYLPRCLPVFRWRICMAV